MPENPDILLPWGPQQNNHHNVRVCCDLGGLTYDQKEVLAACVKVESDFLNYRPDGTPITHKNIREDGSVGSIDYGIVQVNSRFHIGPGLDFPSVEYVLSHPQECVQWMVAYYRRYGHLNAWCSFTSGAYKEHLGKV